ncbi:HAD family hydrolase [Sporomusa acidovorans]|uniref:Phosphoglycolate phosphatase n=1 Tax=Sporomusa acidovorans (strain ATCC 49682 / DSM 3132 / Mol) TaxID=1123286 RepID=A0ABZ3J4W5_SPOA4|nr:HAD family hydrolase [Sporomusa acidovorans]OZC15499.1 phosphoglycolate phosphatase [Sporomusa acidovorans DSM 3132]SDE16228.1 FMN phosphatase YigB, HAD superfamily [Sporomusa acidovorans]
MIKSVLFDLDGTLLPLNQDDFAREYLTHIGAKVAQVIDPKKFVSQLLASTDVMVRNKDKTKTNQQVFLEDFLHKIGVAREILLPVIDEFYETDFVLVKSITRRAAAARQAIMAVIECGLDVVVATNPIFPASAVRQRLAWAGVDDINFKLITSYEQSHFCKPHVEYYLEIAAHLGRLPAECLMVGNDVKEDLAAARIGMTTYLVTDCLLNVKNAVINTDYQGTLQELAQTIAQIIKER